MATVRNVTYNNINVDNCEYAAQIQSCYGSDDAASCAASPSTSSITDVHFNGFTGKTSGKVYDTIPQECIFNRVHPNIDYYQSQLPIGWDMQHLL